MKHPRASIQVALLLLAPAILAVLPLPPGTSEVVAGTSASQTPADRIELDGNAMTILLGGQAVVANATISFDFHTQAKPTPRSFSSTSTVGTFTNQSIVDARGSGTRYSIRYDGADARLHVTVTVYPGSHAAMLNATIEPLTSITFDSRLHLLSLDDSGLLPAVPRAGIRLSYFESDNIWGSYKAVDFSTTVWWARTPILVDGPSTGLLFGALTSEKWELEATHLSGRFTIENVIIEGYTSGAGVNVSSEQLWMQPGSTFSDLFLTYADEARAANQPVRARVVENFFSTASGACDWYSHYGNINEASVLEEIDVLSKLPATTRNFYIMDDGWGSDQICLYVNWSSWDPAKFPGGITACVAKAHAAGLKFVVWNRIGFAPTWVQQNHPDWVSASFSEPLKDSLFNLTKPEVQSYIAAVFDAWKAQGIDGLKVDFISYVAGSTWNAAAWSAGKTRTTYINLFLDILDREAARCNLTILLCGTPYGYPSLAKFPNLVASRVTGDSASQGTFLDWQVPTALMRSFWWARAFNHTPDPDAYDTRDSRSVLVTAATGGAVYYGNEYRNVKAGKALFTRDLRWDAPAVPDNVAYRGDLLACRGTWHGSPTAIMVNLGSTTEAWYIGGLPASCSVLDVVEMCTSGGVGGSYAISSAPGTFDMFIFFTGEAPFGALSCAVIAGIKIALVAGSIALLGIAGFLLVKKIHPSGFRIKAENNRGVLEHARSKGAWHG